MNLPAAGKPKVPIQRLTDAERHALLLETRAARPAGDPMWVFGFGSLMWNPGFDHDVASPAILRGYDRKFRILTMLGRGTPENPGLGLCLEDCSGACRGIAFRVREETIDETWDKLWAREMGSGIYKPRWLAVETETHGRVPALTFVINRDHPHYTGPLPVERMAEIMAGACGKYGRCRDYLAGTVEEMRKLGVVDPELDRLLALVDDIEAASGATT